MTGIFNGFFAKLKAKAMIIGVSDQDKTLTASEFKSGRAYFITGNNRAGAKITVPASESGTFWGVDADYPESCSVKCGANTVTIDPGSWVAIVNDGSADGIEGSELTGTVASSAWQAIDNTDSPFQAAAGNHLDVDTGTAAVTVTLPASPAKYDEIWFRNSTQSFATHALTIGRNGSSIMGVAEDMTVSTDGADFSLWFNGTTWQLPGAQL